MEQSSEACRKACLYALTFWFYYGYPRVTDRFTISWWLQRGGPTSSHSEQSR